MHCIKCGKPLPPAAVFCAHCGAKQSPVQASAKPAAPGASPAAKSGAPWVAIGSMVAGTVILAGAGYWGWANQAAKEEAARNVAEQPQRASLVTPVTDRGANPVDAAERAEIVAAQAALGKHIIEEETQAKARAGIK